MCGVVITFLNLLLALVRKKKYPKHLLRCAASRRPGMSESDRVNTCCHDLRCHLEALNAAKFGEVQSHLEAAVTNLMANARWRFIDGNGPRVDKVSAKEPIMYK